MHLGKINVKTPWVLLCDSDVITYRGGILDAMFEKVNKRTYMIGEGQYLDEYGYNIRGNGNGGFLYIHPHFALIRKSLYESLPPFERHGAPCLRNQKEAVKKGFQLVDFPVAEYVFHFGRGMVEHFGYRLGVGGQVNKIKRLMKRFLKKLKFWQW